MPRKSKEFLRRSAAAKLGWRTRRRHERERSERAQRAAATRARNKRAEEKRSGGAGGGAVGGGDNRSRIPDEFVEYDDLFYEGFEADEEDEY